jgi:hypothetical protein
VTGSGERPRHDFRGEHIASRKSWGRFIVLKTALHRTTVSQVDQFLEQVRTRLEQTKR